jgi:hypothetical protein
MITGVGCRHILKIPRRKCDLCEHRHIRRAFVTTAIMVANSLEFLEVDDGRGHETQQKYQQCKESGEAAIGVEWSVVVDRGSA